MIRKKTILLFMVIFISSCTYHRYISLPPRMPVITRPVRPNIPTIKVEDICNDPIKLQLVETIMKLQNYSKQLETGIDTYNKWAKKSNESQIRY